MTWEVLPFGAIEAVHIDLFPCSIACRILTVMVEVSLWSVGPARCRVSKYLVCATASDFATTVGGGAVVGPHVR